MPTQGEVLSRVPRRIADLNTLRCAAADASPSQAANQMGQASRSSRASLRRPRHRRRTDRHTLHRAGHRRRRRVGESSAPDDKVVLEGCRKVTADALHDTLIAGRRPPRAACFSVSASTRAPFKLTSGKTPRPESRLLPLIEIHSSQRFVPSAVTINLRPPPSL